MMRKLKLYLIAILVGISIALTYLIFEGAVHKSINLIWYDWLNTDNVRWLVLPAAIFLTLIFFGVQHILDPKSEKKEEKGLGETPKFTIPNYLTILIIGFFSLVAGASLGPEAVLVPACAVAGGYFGTKFFKKSETDIKLMVGAAITALFTAFFSSFVVGILSIAIVVKRLKTKADVNLIVVAVLSCGSAIIVLKLLEAKPYVDLPTYSWKTNLITILVSLLLVIAGFVTVYFMSIAHTAFEKIKLKINNFWIKLALAASVGIAILYLLGGPLVEFTGNKSIVPMFQQAKDLGLIGLIWLLFIKVLAIGWSKAIGYRGGMIFPTIFLASVLVAMVELYVHDYNFIYGIIAVLVGGFIANRKTGIFI